MLGHRQRPPYNARMLRILVISLFVANLLLFGFWARDSAVQPKATAKPAVAKNSDVPTIHLFSEMMQDQGLLSDNRQCFSLGPFHSTDEVDEDYTLLLDVAVNIKERQTQALVEKGYWVYLPPYKDLLTANETLLSLQALGLKDIVVIYNGEWTNAISLGYFLRQENALRRKKSLEDRGFTPLIRVQRQAEDRFWLDYEQNPGSGLIALDMQNRPNDFMQRALPCPEQEVVVEDVAPPAEQVATAVQAPVSAPEVDNEPEPEEVVSAAPEIADPEPEETESASPEISDPEPEEAEFSPPENSASESEQSAGNQPEDDEPQQDEPETQLSTEDNDPVSEQAEEQLTADDFEPQANEPQSNESDVLSPIESDEPILEQDDDTPQIEEADQNPEEQVDTGPEELEQQQEESDEVPLEEDSQIPEDLDPTLPVEIDDLQTSESEQLPTTENELEDDGETPSESGEVTNPDPGTDADPYDGDEIEINEG